MERENPTIETCPGITRRTVANGKTMYQMIATLRPGVACQRTRTHRNNSFTFLEALTGPKFSRSN